ncbi:hypothetical protein [Nocardioides sp.]|uniref:hypothetical protein n=1 Tax=Nocardioides sp. TaxID=35761 RepID=UPI00286E1AC5|nr:hypothetical protein [Nocardioides sp.]
MFGLGGLYVTIGMEEMDLGRGRIQNDDPELNVTGRCAVLDGGQQSGGWLCLVGDDKDPDGAGFQHGSFSLDGRTPVARCGLVRRVL